MSRPLVPVALCYVAGVLLANWVELPLAATMAAAAIVGLGTLMGERTGKWLLGPLLALAGAANLILHTAVISPHDLRTVIAERPEVVTLRGRLCETPYQRIYERDEEETWRTVAQIEVHAVRLAQGAWQPAFGRVAASTPGVLPKPFFAGQAVEVTGVLAPPKGPLAEGLFDYRTYLRRLGMYYQLKVLSPGDWRLDERHATTSLPWTDRFSSWAKAILALGLPVEDEPLRLLWAMTLGWKTALTGEVSEPFMRSGTMHVFAISGLHIALIAGILVAVLRVLKVPRVVCGALVIPLIWLYTAATGWQASAIRSTVMMTVVIAGWSLRRPSDLLNSLAAAAFLILLWDPQQIFQASFQLSFFVVLSLALFAPILRKVQERLLAPDPLLPDELRPRWQRWGLATGNHLATGLTTSLAAWLGSIPLIAFYFHLFTPVSLLANLVVVPLSSAALACNLASLAVGAWFPACAEWFNHSAWLWMLLMVRVSEWAARLPGGCFSVATPSFLVFVLYYAALISVMAGWLVRPRVRVWTGAALGGLGLACLAQWQHGRAATQLTILPLGGGEAMFLSGRHSNGGWLIDCGNESSVQFVTTPFLRAQGLDRLQRLLLTHGDIRNVGGGQGLIEHFRVREVLVSAARFRSPSYRAICDRYAGAAGRLRRVRAGDRLGSWEVLHPGDEQTSGQADDNTLVLLGDFSGTRVLLLSDLGKAGQNALLQRRPDLRADIVVSGLPGQTEPLADTFLDRLQPRLIVVTDSEYPATARASPQLRDRLARRRVPVICTRDSGAVTLELRPGQWRLSTMTGPTLRSEGR